MRLIDEQYVATPFYGVPRMTAMLRRAGYGMSPKRVERLMKLMGIQAICPKGNLSKPAPGHKIYPYLLRGVAIERPNQVWSTDITYVRMLKGFMYLCVIMDWYSRYVLSWRLSNSLDARFCIEALEEALSLGISPEIFNLASELVEDPTKAASLPLRPLPGYCSTTASKSAWTAGAGRWTTSLSRGCGGQ